MNFHGDMAIKSLRNWKTQNLRTYNFEIAQDGSKKDFFDYFFLQNYSFLYEFLFPIKIWRCPGCVKSVLRNSTDSADLLKPYTIIISCFEQNSKMNDRFSNSFNKSWYLECVLSIYRKLF